MNLPQPPIIKDMETVADPDAVDHNTPLSNAGSSRIRSPTALPPYITEGLASNSESHPQKPEQQANASTPSFDISLSSESDRIALTRYTNQALTSLAAYRDALIDENGRLNAMIHRAQAGLQLSNDDTATERLVDGSTGQGQQDRARRMGRRRQLSLVNIVRDGMKEELQHLRNKAVQLKQEEETIPGPTVGGTAETFTQPTSPEDPTMIMYYTIVNKLQSDLTTSKNRRADAIAALASTSRGRPAKSPRRSRTAGRGALGRDSSWYGRSSDVAGNGRSSSQHNGTRESGSGRYANTASLQTQMAELAEIESFLPYLTDQEESVWQRERRESEMEKALRDMRCYVETMIREWRDVSDGRVFCPCI